MVLHLAFAFPGFQTSNVLINPHNLVVQAVLRTMLDEGDYFFCALQSQGQITAFRADIGSENLVVNVLKCEQLLPSNMSSCPQ